jgi:hypothetical protein
MKDIALPVKEFSEKAKAAKTDVVSVIRLRELPRPSHGASFMVEKRLYVWMDDDETPHDGQSSIIPLLSAGAPGRYRRAMIGMPLIRS